MPDMPALTEINLGIDSCLKMCKAAPHLVFASMSFVAYSPCCLVRVYYDGNCPVCLAAFLPEVRYARNFGNKSSWGGMQKSGLRGTVGKPDLISA
jgi:hypothetical protein